MDDKSKTSTGDDSSTSANDVYDFKAGKDSEKNTMGSSEIAGKREEKDSTASTTPPPKDGVKASQMTNQAGTSSNKEEATATTTLSNPEKRALDASEEDFEDDPKKKKRKEESSTTGQVASLSTSSSATASSLALSKPSRSTRGSSSEKVLTSKLSTSKGSSRSSSNDRRSPPAATSVTNSPKKPSSRDQSDDDEESRKAATNNDNGNQLKVPPLKIVLTSGGSQNGSGSGTPTTTSGPTSNSGNDSEKNTPNNPADGSNKDKVSNDSDLTVSANASAAVDSGDADTDTKSVSSTNNTRLTRSRANQGTPGPTDGATDTCAGNATDSSATSEPPSTMTPSTVPTAATPVATTTSTTSYPSTSVVTSITSSSSYADYHVKKRKLRSQVEEAATSAITNVGSQSTTDAKRTFGGGSAATNSNNSCMGTAGQAGAGVGNSASIAGAANGTANISEPLNDIEKYLNIRKQVEQRRKNLFPVQPKPPQGFKDYLMNRKTYLLQGNAPERLRSIPMIQPPPSLDGPLRDLFKGQEEARYKLRMKHVVEKEKLVLAVEQEILRVHGRAARALANQSLPYSVCTILRDEEIYTPIDPQQEEKNRDIRSRYNGRLFLSWLQDVDDKWEKIKEQMVLRHHNEAESLNAVQKMDWEWKVNEISVGNGPGNDVVPQMDDLHIPMVHVSDDFDLANS